MHMGYRHASGQMDVSFFRCDTLTGRGGGIAVVIERGSGKVSENEKTREGWKREGRKEGRVGQADAIS